MKKEEVIAKLEELKIPYNKEADYETLCKVLKHWEKEDVPTETKEAEEKPKKREVKRVPCGVGTINDHEKRLCEIEDNLDKLCRK